VFSGHTAGRREFVSESHGVCQVVGTPSAREESCALQTTKQVCCPVITHNGVSTTAGTIMHHVSQQFTLQ